MGNVGCEKIVVAVHGIGDQVRFETIQKVARMFCRCSEVQGAIPLGRLYGKLKHDPGVCKGFFHFVTPPDPDMPELGLAEVYWADIPRAAAKDGYILEESKEWARTIVERLRCRQDIWLEQRLKRRALTLWEKARRLPKTLVKPPDLELSRSEFKTVKQVLTEMIESIGILEHLVAWLGKTTKFKFDLKSVLTDYLGDVQVVTEYEPFRREILDEFHCIMGGIASAPSSSEIYIVAHSEGTVVSFLALLEALKLDAAGNKKYEWIKKVKGLMTFGSPIGKHITLWPELWKEFELMQWRDLEKIPWFNYYDYGDPIGFELAIARRWMAGKANHPPFDFPPENDIGFGRYPFPGKAHNDYWRDDIVFQHFIGNVEGLRCFLRNPEVNEKPQSELFKGRLYVKPISNILPYLLVLALCTAGIWVFYKATAGVVGFDACRTDLAWNVAVLGLALALSTAATRLPRLARAKKYWALAAGLLVAAIMVVSSAPTEKLLNALDIPAPRHDACAPVPAAAGVSLPASLSAVQQGNSVLVTFRCTTSLVSPGTASSDIRTAAAVPQICGGLFDRVGAMAGTAFDKMWDHLGLPARLHSAQATGWRCPHPLVLFNLLFVLISGAFGFRWPKWGLALSLFSSGALIIGWVMFVMFQNQMALPLWPAFTAGGVFLYFWWLAAMFFDLTFVWHRYIRRNVGLMYMDEIARGPRNDGDSGSCGSSPPSFSEGEEGIGLTVVEKKSSDARAELQTRERDRS